MLFFYSPPRSLFSADCATVLITARKAPNLILKDVADIAASGLILRFGNFELEETTGELRRDGLLVKLTPRQFRLLRFLLRNSGRVVTREEIQTEIWGDDTFVDFQRNLNVCVAQLRAALNDDSESPRFIKTVPRRGYRFVAPVETPAVVAERPAVRRRVLPVISVAVLAICALLAFLLLRPAPQPEDARIAARIAVLPFISLIADDDPLLDGITSELIGALGSQTARLSVIGRASIMRYKGSAPDLGRVSRDLHADYVVEGTLRHDRQRSRLTVSLLRLKDQVQVWTETFERDAANSFELQEDVAARVAAGVLRSLFPQAKLTARPSRGVSEAAYQAYLKGRYLQRKGNRADLNRSESFFQTAALSAPEFAAAHAALAETYVSMARSGGGPEAFDKAKPAAEAALRLDPMNAEAHNALGNALFWHEWSWAAAEREFQAAIDANPSFAPAYHDHAFFLVAMGRREAGLSALRRAMALDPLSVRVTIDAGWLLLQAHSFEEAITQARRALELEPGLRAANACIARAQLLQGGGGAAPSDSAEPFMHAVFLAITGDNEKALASLERAYAGHSSMMPLLNSEPAFTKLHEDARFRALAGKMHFP